MTSLVAVIGSGSANATLATLAHQVGTEIARRGHGLVCGGRGGVMEAACHGAYDIYGPTSGRIIAILPGTDPTAANPYADIVLPTGLGQARNLLIVLSASAIVTVGGESGTLSEMALAWKHSRPLAALRTSGGWAERIAAYAPATPPIALFNSATDVGEWLDSTLNPLHRSSSAGS